MEMRAGKRRLDQISPGGIEAAHICSGKAVVTIRLCRLVLRENLLDSARAKHSIGKIAVDNLTAQARAVQRRSAESASFKSRETGIACIDTV
jgi:hypothetical protein